MAHAVERRQGHVGTGSELVQVVLESKIEQRQGADHVDNNKPPPDELVWRNCLEEYRKDSKLEGADGHGYDPPQCISCQIEIGVAFESLHRDPG